MPAHKYKPWANSVPGRTPSHRWAHRTSLIRHVSWIQPPVFFSQQTTGSRCWIAEMRPLELEICGAECVRYFAKTRASCFSTLWEFCVRLPSRFSRLPSLSQHYWDMSAIDCNSVQLPMNCPGPLPLVPDFVVQV